MLGVVVSGRASARGRGTRGEGPSASRASSAGAGADPAVLKLLTAGLVERGRGGGQRRSQGQLTMNHRAAARRPVVLHHVREFMSQQPGLVLGGQCCDTVAEHDVGADGERDRACPLGVGRGLAAAPEPDMRQVVSEPRLVEAPVQGREQPAARIRRRRRRGPRRRPAPAGWYSDQLVGGLVRLALLRVVHVRQGRLTGHLGQRMPEVARGRTLAWAISGIGSKAELGRPVTPGRAALIANVRRRLTAQDSPPVVTLASRRTLSAWVRRRRLATAAVAEDDGRKAIQADDRRRPLVLVALS